MNRRDSFDRILASLYDAMLDEAHWSAASALIDDACGSKGNFLMYGDGCSQEDVRLFFVRFCYRGQRHEGLERQYLDLYYPRDERVPRVRRLPDSQLVHASDLFTDQELKTSVVYNEALPLSNSQNSLCVRLDGPDGSRIVWCNADPVGADGWSSNQIDVIEHLLPHIRQFVRIRQVLVDAEALGTSLTGLLDNTRSGVIQLDWRGRVVAANDHARDHLRSGDGLTDQAGFLRARLRTDNAELQRLLARALPRYGGQGTSGSIGVKRGCVLPRLMLHIVPWREGENDFRSRRVAALVLVVDPASQARIEPALVAAALDLTPAESHVAVMLAEGMTIRDIAAATGRRESTIRWHAQQIFKKNGISRQVELVQLVLSLAGVPEPLD